MRKADLVIIGGGPAGLAAAVSAYEQGVRDILLLERDPMLGGILNQCIHNGFGLHTFQEELTGPEYAARYINKVETLPITCLSATMVTEISGDKVVTAINEKDGVMQIQAGAVILAMGCRERARGALKLPGTRPAGIYTAGAAQYFVNIEGKMPGKEVVILGSGDIGLIMARRMTLEGSHVKVVAELMPYSGGLKRNIVQCLDDFQIPLRLSTTVVQIHGKKRLEGVTLAQVDDRRRPICGTEEYIPCDTLLLSCGLIPENELTRKMGAIMDPVTGGPLVDESLETSIPGVFACGNVLQVHDLVDFVSREAALAGVSAAAYLQKQKPEAHTAGLLLEAGNGVRYTVPRILHRERLNDTLTVSFRTGGIYKNAAVCVHTGDTVLMQKKKRILTPGEMETVSLKKEQLAELPEGSTLTIEIQEG